MKQFFLFFMLLQSTFTFSQSTTWTGASSVFWNDPSNWSSGTPDFSKDAFIGSGGMVEIVGPAQARSITNAGQLNIQATSTVDVFGSSTNGIRNSGSLTSSGVIFVRGVAHDGILNGPMGTIKQNAGAQLIVGDPSLFVFDNGIENYGIVENQASASMLLKNLSHAAINNLLGTFVNSGLVTIQNIAAEGVYNKANFMNVDGELLIEDTKVAAVKNAAVFQNSADLTITDVDGVGLQNGIDSAGTLLSGNFFNDLGNVVIRQTTAHGVWNREGDFNNQAQVMIRDQIEGLGILNQSMFINDMFANLAIHQTDSHGVLNLDSFFNRATFIIDTVSMSGFVNGTTLTMGAAYFGNESGLMHISHCLNHGFINQIGNCKNDANIYISVAHGVNAMENYAKFFNTSTGELEIDSASNSGLINYNFFLNHGDISINDVDSIGLINGNAVMAKSGTFTNEFGNLHIQNSGYHGLWNDFGHFDNSASLSISNCRLGNGIYNFAYFVNDTPGQVQVIDRSQIGIFNLDLFENYADIIVDSSLVYGIQNGQLSDTSKFVSYSGDITIFNGFGTGIINVDSCLFYEGTNLLIHDLTGAGIFNKEVFISRGDINITSMGSYGILNGVFFPVDHGFFHHLSGTIAIEDVSADGIRNSKGIISNADTVTIADVLGNYGFFNRDSFANFASAYMTFVGADVDGLRNHGSARNAGIMIFTDSFAQRALNSNQKFWNTSTGEIIIHSFSQSGITHAGAFYNEGLIDIDGHCTSSGISSANRFNNYETGKIYIRQSDGNGHYAAYPNAIVNNYGLIDIGDRVDKYGIRMLYGSTFFNHDSIYIKACSTGVILNGGDSTRFNNLGGALLQIDSVSRTGIGLIGDVVLENKGQINIVGDGAIFGVDVYGGSCFNDVSGQLHVRDILGNGFRVLFPSGLLTNLGFLHVVISDYPGADGIWVGSDGVFFNAIDATLIVDYD